MFLENITDVSTIVEESQIEKLQNLNWNDVWNAVIKWCINDGIKIIIALVIWFFSFKLINIITRRISKRIARKSVDKTIETVVLSIIRKGLKLLIFLSLLAYLGIETSGIAALLASAGLGIGLAVQGSLSNVAGGVLILLTRPFRIGDFIETLGARGTVEDIGIIYTRVVTPDNKVISVPNGTLANSSITNYSLKDIRRVDLVFSISYGDDFNKARKVILKCVQANALILKDPEPFVNIMTHNTSSIDMVCRVWVKTEDFWTVHFALLESVKAAFDKANITIPFPQVDVHNIKK